MLVEQCEAAGDSGLFDLFGRDNSIVARDFVDIGTEASGPAETELDTDGLATCQGIAVVGEYEDDDNEGDAVFMAHVGATDQTPLNTLVDKVKAAQAAGLGNIKITVVYCDADSVPEDMAAAAPVLSGLNDGLFAKLGEISDASVTEEKISWEETAKLEIDDDGEISFEKREI